ncbi:class I SAM-dependent methyltransferase [Bradyrhizobium sp. th.b2]|uniref:class I SAM-dependent methyltransferase n=1 Tax=Bradyrhizobium sp. th-b2 TaxID=172088 RepID=UPI0012EC2769|nr:class I SAM-dependent methyltransferase [Bradyrhizobium sp. th.b2]
MAGFHHGTMRFERPYLKIENDIPVFEENDAYIENYDRIASDHLEGLRRTGSNPFMSEKQIQETIQSVQDLVRAHVAPGSRLLDVGIGLGGLMATLTEYERYGLDIAMPYLQECKKLVPNLCLSRIENAPFESSFFDAIVTVDVLEHVLQLDRAMQQIDRMLKPGGYIIVDVPNEERLDSYLPSESVYDYVHVRGFSLSGLRLLFQRIWGYEYIAHRFSGWLLNSFDNLKLCIPEGTGPVQDILNSEEAQVPELDGLRSLRHYDQDRLSRDLVFLRDRHPDLARKLFHHILRPVELTSVFRKPLSAR